MAGASLFLLFGKYSSPRAVFLALSVCFVIVAFQAISKNRWAVAISILVASLVMVRWLPMVVVNSWMFISGHELYQNSPATIFIVIINIIIFTAPSTALCISYFLNRKKLWQLIRYNKAWSA